MMEDYRFYLIAGETSGDIYGGDLVRQFRKKLPGASFRGFGGGEMQNEKVILDRELNDLALIGIMEVLFKWRTVRTNFRVAKRAIRSYRPNALILIDYPGFNLRMAKWAAARNIPVFYYVAPQTWAWKESRNRIIRAYVKRLFVILPFEKAYFESKGIQTDFVGHPMAYRISRWLKGKKVAERQNNSEGKPVIAVFPGSRMGEISRFAPILTGLFRKMPEYEFRIACMQQIGEHPYEAFRNIPNVRLVFDKTLVLMHEADLGLVKSGTSTLQASLIGLPQLVFYGVNPVSAWIMRRLVKVKYISLPNLILDKAVVPELIQEKLSVHKLQKALQNLHAEGTALQIEACHEIRKIMHTEVPPAQLVAEAILKILQSS